jgi:hypothetical protein
MGLNHPLDGVTNLEYKLLYFLTPYKKISKRKAGGGGRRHRKKRRCLLKLLVKMASGNTKEGSITVPLISCLTGLESAV